MLNTLIIVAVVLVVVAGILIHASTRPNTFRVQRTLGIEAPPDRIFAMIDDLKAWTAWSPYEKKDPAMKRSFGAVTAGKGATYAWDGKHQVGQGSMEMLESAPARKVAIKLDFFKPFEAHNTAEFVLESRSDATDVHLGDLRAVPPDVQGDGPVHRYGHHDRQGFRGGLANLKAAVEK